MKHFITLSIMLGGGYIILAADKRSTPILAYFENEKFPTNLEDYPSELVDWLEFAKNQIEEIREKNLEQPVEFAEEWRDYESIFSFLDFNGNPNTTSQTSNCTPTFQQVSPLLQTKWNQIFGFNNYLPTAPQIGCSSINTGNNRAFAGCVPIAIAQIMKYHNFPTNFNWNNMPNNSYGNNTISSLILDIHQKINSQNPFNATPLSYSCSSTGVSSSYDVGKLFKNRYGYSSAQYNSIISMPTPLRILSDVSQSRPVGKKSWLVDFFGKKRWTHVGLRRF